MLLPAPILLPLERLAAFHRNPRRGDVPKIAESLSVNRQYRPIVVNAGTKTGREMEILAGNHTYAAAKHLGWTELWGTVIDVDDLEAARIVVADNRTADLGTYDEAELKNLLEGLALTDDGLAGTGYDEILESAEAAPTRSARPAEVRVGEFQMRLTADELSWLEAKLAWWAEMTSSYFGFGGWLIEAGGAQ